MGAAMNDDENAKTRLKALAWTMVGLGFVCLILSIFLSVRGGPGVGLLAPGLLLVGLGLMFATKSEKSGS